MTKKVKKIAKPKVKKEIVEIVKKAERTICVEGDVQVKPGIKKLWETIKNTIF